MSDFRFVIVTSYLMCITSLAFVESYEVFLYVITKKFKCLQLVKLIFSDVDVSDLQLLQELPDVPLFLSLHNLCATLKCTSPSAVIFRSAVINAGYRISGTHVNPLGLKSDAPMDVIWDIMRCWVRFFLLDACKRELQLIQHRSDDNN